MPDLIVVTPTRGRPRQAWRLLKAFEATCTGDTELLLIVDADDPQLPGYRDIEIPVFAELIIQDRLRGLNRISNEYGLWAADRARVVGNMGDDHLPRTGGWDQRILDTLAGRSGVAYGDDLLQSERLPTAPFITSDLIQRLGFYAPPVLEHMFVDNFWLTLGRATSLHYLPDVVIEHMHPFNGKAPADEGYERADATLEADRRAWHRYLYGSGWQADLTKLQGLEARCST